MKAWPPTRGLSWAAVEEVPGFRNWIWVSTFQLGLHLSTSWGASGDAQATPQTNHIRIPGCGVQVPVGFKLPQWLQCAAELAKVFEVGLGMSLPCRARVMKVSE